MAKLTNISGTPRLVPLKSGDYVEFAKGETKDFPDADYHAIADRDDIKACFTADDVAAAAPAPKSKKVTIKDAD